MGQHKTNPTAIAAKNGELPPKPTKLSKRERDRQLNAEVMKVFYNAPATKALISAMENTTYTKF